MSSNKKSCCYQDCTTKSNVTLFKFPDIKDSERYSTWLENCGLDDDVDRNELRFLCEKHFSKRYIAAQSRRKMLVHTAVPLKIGEIETYNPCEIIEDIIFELQDAEAIPPTSSMIIPKFEEFTEQFIILPEQKILNKQASPSQSQQRIKLIPKRNYTALNDKKISKSKSPVSSNEINSSYHEESLELPDLEESIESPKLSLPTVKKAKIVKCHQTESPKMESSEEVGKKLTEFIFMGEMYVQMTKALYLTEKKEYEEKILHYRNILKGLGSQIKNTLDENFDI